MSQMWQPWHIDHNSTNQYQTISSMNPSRENDSSHTKNGSWFKKVSPQCLMTPPLAKVVKPILLFGLGNKCKCHNNPKVLSRFASKSKLPEDRHLSSAQHWHQPPQSSATARESPPTLHQSVIKHTNYQQGEGKVQSPKPRSPQFFFFFRQTYGKLCFSSWKLSDTFSRKSTWNRYCGMPAQLAFPIACKPQLIQIETKG